MLDVMYTALLQVVVLLAVFILPMFIFGKKIRNKKVKTVNYKIDTDTSEARYAINENGFLEEINTGKLSKHRS
ncbi:hypothetical protein DIU31_001120 [Mucilaginibacter rubeus]|uniref:Uncharacterized protein n=2 Tax=Mucilaginibacter TaxID=423349 RepID=A0AAE6JAZ3_9SPHI|nr:hypothetical protein [Mucilaginibacter rubeus]QEM14816.1 hypothetical protein DIU38_001145 [Mucilaginibacter gossypii]QEM02188.1 hypothetical protein DIU31_001120 [Mucilaginibacter rubeus]QTE42476.1 hypothetical protein J3L19_26670 [Mucilaginibacter rubeus]QTE49079.1 hypothetical protein J3L21_26645 [Mucilaginibacter rubeus]QTE54177.1 hypothetical protein J3L23_18270 [Mucilaginibacter rubeus]